eukprot:scaffold11912_cov36-Phaeocystis_antarctica.AAC.2
MEWGTSGWCDPFIGVAPARASSSQPAATGRRGPPLPPRYGVAGWRTAARGHRRPRCAGARTAATSRARPSIRWLGAWS